MVSAASLKKSIYPALVAILAAAAGCRSSAPPAKTPPPETTWGLYRLDDQLASATVAAPQASASVQMAQRVVWDFNDQKITWDLIRGRMGFKKGELVVKGEGSTPVIIAPTNPSIDWSRYEEIRIRMIAEAGREIKLKLGDDEMRQPLAPPGVYRVYRFNLKPTGSSFTHPLAMMPTDDLFAPVAIDFIELIPRKESLSSPAGRTSVGKREEYRNALFARTPAAITYEFPVPKRAPVLHFGMGISGGGPVAFRIVTGPSSTDVFSRTLSDPDAWEDAEVDLAPYAGKTTRFRFLTVSEAPGAVGFWSNPLVASRAPKSRPNILLYVVCTLRPDHTSLYGYQRDTTPFLKKLGAAGVVFDDAIAQAPWTKPSVSSILTSLYSFTHGLVNDTDTIPRGAATMAEQLRAVGYVTASIVANPFAGRTSGLDRGFDYMFEYPVVQRHRNESVDRGTDSAAINRALMPWLDRHKDEPFFLYVQSTDPHAPYQPPADFEAKFADPSATAEFNRQYTALRLIRAYGGGATVNAAEIRAKGIDPAVYTKRAIDRYDGEIANNDASIEALVGKIRDLGVLDNTLVIVASDHGEEFWEHGLGAHGHSLYQELIHSVLVMWNPRLLPQPRRVAEPVQLIDIMPTVLEMAGAQIPATAEGQSLVPLLKGRRFTRTGALMSSKLALPHAKPAGGVPENLTDSFARISPEWKLIYRAQARRAGLKEVELYDRHADRADRNDVAAQHPDIAAKMKGEVDQWIGAQKQVKLKLGPGGSRPLDTQTIERLRSLGYLAGKDEKK